jgi:hypothetical protein
LRGDGVPVRRLGLALTLMVAAACNVGPMCQTTGSLDGRIPPTIAPCPSVIDPMSVATRIAILALIVGSAVVAAIFLGVQVGGCACPVSVPTM